MTGLVRSPGRPLSPAEQCGMAAFALAALLWLCAPFLAVLPLAGFVGACLLAPAFPGWAFFYPVLCHGARGPESAGCIALTFDDGPDPVSTPLLLALLARHGFPATFFVTGRRVRQYPAQLSSILAAGHEIGNHSFTHAPCMMFCGPERLTQEMRLTRRALSRFGVQPAFFRPPVGINVPAYAEALSREQLAAVNFSCRGRDMGNRRVCGLSARMLKRLRPGDIVLLHDRAPRGGSGGLERWLVEVESLCLGIEAKGLRPVLLSELCGLPAHRHSAQAPRHSLP